MRREHGNPTHGTDGLWTAKVNLTQKTAAGVVPAESDGECIRCTLLLLMHDTDVKTSRVQERNAALADKKTILERQISEHHEKQEVLAAQKAKLEAQSHQQQALISSLEEDLASSRCGATPVMNHVIHDYWWFSLCSEGPECSNIGHQL